MYISICFWAFSSSWKEEKKNCSTSAAETVGLLPNCIAKKKIVLQPCSCITKERARKKKFIGIVLQEKGVVGLLCIARGELYCKRMHVAGKLYCNMVVQWAEIVLR